MQATTATLSFKDKVVFLIYNTNLQYDLVNIFVVESYFLRFKI